MIAPTDTPGRRGRWWRPRRRTLLLAGLFLCVLVAAAPSLRRSFLEWTLDRVARQIGVDLQFDGADVAWSGRLTLAAVELGVGRWHLACGQAETTVGGGQIVSGRGRLADVWLRDCRLSRSAGDGSGSGSTAPPRERLTRPLDEVAELVQRLSHRVDVIHLNRLTVEGAPGVVGQAQLEGVTVESRSGGVTVRAHLSVDGRVSTRDSRLVARFSRSVKVVLNSPLGLFLDTPHGRVRASRTVLSTTAPHLRLDGVDLVATGDDGPSGTVNRVSIDLSAGTPLLSLASARLSMGRAGFDASATPPPDAGEADDFAGVPDRQWIEAALSVVAGQRTAQLHLASLASRLHESGWSVEAADMALRLGGGERLLVETLHAPNAGPWEAVVLAGQHRARLSLDGTDPHRLQWRLSERSVREQVGSAESGLSVAGRLSIEGESTVEPDSNSLWVRARFALLEATVSHPALAPEAVDGIAVAGQAELTVDLGDGGPSARLSSRLEVNTIPIQLDISLAPPEADPDAALLTIAWGVTDEIACQELWEAVPAGLVPHLTHDGVTFSGSARPGIEARHVVGQPDRLEVEFTGFGGDCRIVDMADSYDPRQLLDDEFVHRVTEGVTREDILVGPGTPEYVRLDAVPSYVPALMYLSEEIDFYENPGFAVGLINRGMRMSLEEGRFVYGGSSVTQQLVKNLFLSRERTLQRKLEEALITWATEQWVPKDRILELYMNCIEFAPDVYGIRAAAEHYFGVLPEELSPLQAAYLAALKPAPWRAAEHFRRGHSPTRGWWPRRIEELLNRAVEYGGHIEPEVVDRSAPFVVVFPTSPSAPTVEREVVEN